MDITTEVLLRAVAERAKVLGLPECRWMMLASAAQQAVDLIRDGSMDEVLEDAAERFLAGGQQVTP